MAQGRCNLIEIAWIFKDDRKESQENILSGSLRATP